MHIMNKLKLILSVVFMSVTMVLFSQTINEAGEAFNNGGTHFKAKNYTSAIEEYTKCIEICNGLGEEGVDLLLKAESSLVLSYVNMGKGQYRAKKFDDAISSFQAAFDKSADDKKKKAAQQYLSRVYNSKATAFYSAKKYSDALVAYDKSLEYDGKYVKAVYGKALVYRKQKNVESFKAAVDQIIGMAPATNKTVAKTLSTASKFFIAEGGKALQASNFKKAVDMLNTGFAYKAGNAQSYYFAAIAYNGLSQWQKAIEAGNKSISLEKKSKSNAYFEIAKAYEGAGNKAKACSSYKNVTDGPNLASAKYKIETELKCN